MAESVLDKTCGSIPAKQCLKDTLGGGVDGCGLQGVYLGQGCVELDDGCKS